VSEFGKDMVCGWKAGEHWHVEQCRNAGRIFYGFVIKSQRERESERERERENLSAAQVKEGYM
jgi:hypothetical protein